MKDSFLKFRFLLTKNQMLGVKILLALLGIGMIFESGLLYLLIPVIKLITDEEYFISFSDTYFSEIDFINSLDYNTFVLTAMTFLVFTFLIKNLYLIILTYRQNLFTSNLSANLSIRIFKTFLEKKYSFFIEKNSAELIKNMQIDVPNFSALSQSILTFVVELFLSLAVIFSLLYLEPVSAIIAGLTIIISALTYYLITRNKIEKIGSIKNLFEKNVTKVILESIQGIKILKIYNKEKDFLDDMSGKEYGKAKIIGSFNTLHQIPRLIFEFIGILSIIIIIAYKLYFIADKTNLFVTIGLFVAATFKLLPSINRIVGSLQQINYHKDSLDILYNILKNHNYTPKNLKKIDFSNNIELDNISFSYEKENKILDNLSLKINKGEFIGLMGKSGAGKSTLVDLLIGLLEVQKGQILVDGKSISELFKYNIVGYIPQQVTLFDTNILNNITLEASKKGINQKMVEEAIKLSGLKEFIDSSSLGTDTIVGEQGVQISGGQIKRLAIARALYNNPEILIFDEATSALDKKTESDFLNQICKLKGEKTMILISHDINCFRDCDKVYKLTKGQTKLIQVEK